MTSVRRSVVVSLASLLVLAAAAAPARAEIRAAGRNVNTSTLRVGPTGPCSATCVEKFITVMYFSSRVEIGPV